MAQSDFGASIAPYDPSVCDEIWMNELRIPMDLHTSCAVGCEGRVKELLADGLEICDLDKPNREGWTPLMYCSYVGHESLVELLLDNNVDVNAQEHKYHATPLMLSASCGIVPVVSLLLENRARINAQDKRGWTALYYASLLGHQDVAKTLIENNADMELREKARGLTPLLVAAISGHVEIFSLLLESGADLYSRTNFGEDALSLAHSHNNTMIVNLIEQRSFRNLPLRSDAGLLPDDNLWGEDNHSHVFGIHEGPEAFERLRTGKPVEGHAVSKPYPMISKSPTGTPDFTPGSFEEHFYMGSGSTIKTATLQEKLMAVNRHNSSPSHNLSSVERSDTYLPTVAEFLQDLKLERFIPLFEKKAIDFEKLITFSETDLQEIGITTFGPRRKIFSSLNGVRESSMRPSSLPNQFPKSPKQETALEKVRAQVLVLQTQLTQEKQFHTFTKELLKKEQGKLQQVQEIASEVLAMLKEMLVNVQGLKNTRTLLQNENTSIMDLRVSFNGTVDSLEKIILTSSEKMNTIASGNQTSAPSPESDRNHSNQRMVKFSSC